MGWERGQIVVPVSLSTLYSQGITKRRISHPLYTTLPTVAFTYSYKLSVSGTVKSRKTDAPKLISNYNGKARIPE